VHRDHDGQNNIGYRKTAQAAPLGSTHRWAGTLDTRRGHPSCVNHINNNRTAEAAFWHSQSSNALWIAWRPSWSYQYVVLVANNLRPIPVGHRLEVNTPRFGNVCAARVFFSLKTNSCWTRNIGLCFQNNDEGIRDECASRVPSYPRYGYSPNDYESV
jgi:hypothetical protein